MGRLWQGDGNGNFQGFCSGTLVSRGVVLTAGHCLYGNAEMGGGGYIAGPAFFLPGQTWNANGTPNPLYGEWEAKDWWVTQAWVDDQDGLDWGFLELKPNAQGQYPGDVTGSFQIMANIDWNCCEIRTYVVGYPGSGIFAAYPFGNGQYFCDNTWVAKRCSTSAT